MGEKEGGGAKTYKADTHQEELCARPESLHYILEQYTFLSLTVINCHHFTLFNCKNAYYLMIAVYKWKLIKELDNSVNKRIIFK